MNTKQFQYYLDLYGSDWQQWPESLREAAQSAASKHPELIEAAQKLESLMKDADDIPAREGMAERIIAASLRTAPSKTREDASIGLKDWLKNLLHFKPAFALATLLVVGFIGGFWLRGDLSSQGTNDDLASLLYNEEQVLW